MSEIATDPLSPGVLLYSRTWSSCLFFCYSPLQHKKLYIRPHSHQLCKLKMSPSLVHLAYILYIHMVNCSFALGVGDGVGWASFALSGCMFLNSKDFLILALYGLYGLCHYIYVAIGRVWYNSYPDRLLGNNKVCSVGRIVPWLDLCWKEIPINVKCTFL